MREHVALENVPDLVVRWCQALGLQVSARFEPAGNEDMFPNRLVLTGPDAQWLMGNKGQALDALQHLVHERQGDRDAQKLAYLDVQSFRLFRMKELTSMAQLAAQKARDLGSYTFQSLSPRERRWVHLTLDGEKDLRTESEGTGHFKALKIIRC